MADNLNIISRQNVISYIAENQATNLDIVPCKDKENNELRKYKDGTQKYFFALDNKAATRGAVSYALAKELEAGKQLSISDLVVADTIMEGKSEHVSMLMKRGAGNSVQRFSI